MGLFEKTYVVTHVNGLHARPSTAILKFYRSHREFSLINESGEEVSMDILVLMQNFLGPDKRITVRYEGETPDAFYRELGALRCDTEGVDDPCFLREIPDGRLEETVN